jgi:CRP-like cAMP-binding protein
VCAVEEYAAHLVLVRRLSAFRKISPDGLEYAVRGRIVSSAPGQELVCEGDPADCIRIVLSGWLTRYKTLEDGRRQIVNFALPCDTCNAFVYLLRRWIIRS